MSVTICIECTYYTVATDLVPRCGMNSEERIDFVTGENVHRYCRDVNTDGHCPHYYGRPVDK